MDLKNKLTKEERPVDIIRRMNPGKFIPTGEELSKIISAGLPICQESLDRLIAAERAERREG